MKDEVIYIDTSRGRYGLNASIKILNTELVVDLIKNNKAGGGIRYGQVGSYMGLLKEMPLEKFEQIFDPTVFTPDQITRYFRKEISMKYGKHLERSKIKRLPQKEVVRGGVYLTDTGYKYIYLGLVELKTVQDDSYYQKETVETGHGYKSVYGDLSNQDKYRDVSCNILKGKNKKFVEKIGQVDLDWTNPVIKISNHTTENHSPKL